MKKITLIALVVSFLACANSPEKKAEKLIKTFMKENMHNPESYEIVGFGKVDSAFSDYKRNPQYIAQKKECNKLISEVEELQKAEKFAFTTESKYKSLKETAEAAKKAYEANQELVKFLNEYEEEFIGWSVIHQYRATNKGGQKGLTVSKFIFNPDITEIIDFYSEDELKESIGI